MDSRNVPQMRLHDHLRINMQDVDFYSGVKCEFSDTMWILDWIVCVEFYAILGQVLGLEGYSLALFLSLEVAKSGLFWHRWFRGWKCDLSAAQSFLEYFSVLGTDCIPVSIVFFLQNL